MERLNQPGEVRVEPCPFHAECRVYEHKGFVRHELPYGSPCPIAHRIFPLDAWNHRAPSKREAELEKAIQELLRLIAKATAMLADYRNTQGLQRADLFAQISQAGSNARQLLTTKGPA